LMKPTTCDTAYFGGIEIITWTWSDIKCPSSIRLFCSASCQESQLGTLIDLACYVA
jgi:hypothetical protein